MLAVDNVDRLFPIFFQISSSLRVQTSLVALQGFFNAVVYGSTDAVKAAVQELPFVRRFLKKWCSKPGEGGGRAGLGAETRAGGQDIDPEDEEVDTAGIDMGNNLR